MNTGMQEYFLHNGTHIAVERFPSLAFAMLPGISKYQTTWRVHAGVGDEQATFVVGKRDTPSDVHFGVWYPNSKKWAGKGTSVISAIEGAIQDAWRYM